MNTYAPYPVKITATWRRELIALYPRLEDHPRAELYRHLMQYLLFARFLDQQTGRLVTPAQALARMARKAVGQRGFRAIDCLEGFSRDIFPLDIEGHVYRQSKARTVARDLPEALVALALREGVPPAPEAQEGMVWLVSGRPVTRSGQRRNNRAYREQLRALAHGVPPDHPAGELLAYLNDQPPTVLGKILGSNWPDLEAAYHRLPARTAQEQRRKFACQGVLQQLCGLPPMVYAPSGRTARLHALGVSAHQLPRPLRKIALAGCVEMDARACQLAIVSTLWELPRLSAFLRTQGSIWEELLGHLSLDNSYKDLLKRALYAILFGMAQPTLRALLREGTDAEEGLQSQAQVDRFLGHPLIEELLAERTRQQKRIRGEGGACDAFGRWIEHAAGQNPARCVLAQQVQSWELRLMLSLFEAVKQEKDAHLVSWLHDGIGVWFTDKREESSLVRRMKRAFESRASDLGIPTWLEVSD